MDILLDTHFLLWQFIEPEKISQQAQQILLDENNTIYFSSISLWEVAIKYQLNKLDLKGVTPEQFLAEIEQSFLQELSLSNLDLVSFYHLPRHHKDPFDRLLIWQAIHYDLTFMSIDNNNPLYFSQGLKIIN